MLLYQTKCLCLFKVTQLRSTIIKPMQWLYSKICDQTEAHFSIWFVWKLEGFIIRTDQNKFVMICVNVYYNPGLSQLLSCPSTTVLLEQNECHFVPWWITMKILLLCELPLVLFDFDSFNIHFLISDILLINVAQLPQISFFKLKSR